MKRYLLMLLSVAVLSMTAMAQTEFRHITHDEAMTQAKAEGKLVFIDFYTTWCGPCKMMAKQVFPMKEVGDYFNSKFVCIKLDAEKENEGKPYLDIYKVTAYPTFVVVDPQSGKVLFYEAGGNSNGVEFCANIERGINPDLTPEKVKAKYESGNRDPKIVETYVAQLLEQARRKRRNQDLMGQIATIVDDYWKGLTDAQRLEAKNVFVYNYYYIPKISDEKLAFAMSHLSEFEESCKEGLNKALLMIYGYNVGYALYGEQECTLDELLLAQKSINKLATAPGADATETAYYNIILPLQIESAKGNYKEVFNSIEQHIKEYPSDACSAVMMSLSNLLKGDDKELLAKAAKFTREQFLWMPASSIRWAVDSLDALEKRSRGEKIGH